VYAGEIIIQSFLFLTFNIFNELVDKSCYNLDKKLDPAVLLMKVMPIHQDDNNESSEDFDIIQQGRTRPGNSAILLKTGSCTIILTRVDPLSRDALRAAARSTEIAQYLRRLP